MFGRVREPLSSHKGGHFHSAGKFLTVISIHSLYKISVFEACEFQLEVHKVTSDISEKFERSEININLN